MFDASGSSQGGTALADAINHAVATGAKVINLSLGSAAISQGEAAAIQNAYNQGEGVVAASGNESQPTPGYPARQANVSPAQVLAVGAVNRDRQVATFSNGAQADLAIQNFVVQPGVRVLSMAGTGDGFVTENGTSMATPHAAGIEALMLQANLNLTPAQVIDFLNRAADPTGITVPGTAVT